MPFMAMPLLNTNALIVVVLRLFHVKEAKPTFVSHVITIIWLASEKQRQIVSADLLVDWVLINILLLQAN